MEPDAALRLRWTLACDEPSAERCRGQQQYSYRATVTDASGAVLHDSGPVIDTSPFCALEVRGLSPDTTYSVAVSNGEETAEATFRTSLTAGSVGNAWRGAEWISGGTQLRGAFNASSVKHATAYASGVGLFQMTLNGAAVSDSFLDPGFSTVPSWRMLYRAYNVTSLIQDGANAVGVRLAQGKYGYLESYCTPSDAFQPACRAFILCLSMELEDGTRQSFTTGANSSAWMVTTEGNPVHYTHLYHGEQYDARREQPGWDTAAFTPSSPLWTTAISYSKAADIGPLSLFTTPPIRITESRSPVRIYPDGTKHVFGAFCCGRHPISVRPTLNRCTVTIDNRLWAELGRCGTQHCLPSSVWMQLIFCVDMPHIQTFRCCTVSSQGLRHSDWHSSCLRARA